MARDDLLTIGTLSARTGVSVSAIRFYERKGLVASVRGPGGHRRFPRATIRQLSIIVVCQRLGYPLADIQERLAALPSDRVPAEAEWAAVARDFRVEIDDRIERLLSLRDHLDGCIGCGCLSLDVCLLHNPDDGAARLGPGPRYLLGESPADLGTAAPHPDPRPDVDPHAPTKESSVTESGPDNPAPSPHPDWHLAQINIGRLHHPVDDPRVAEFMDNLDPINALAERSPGFVWRLQDESGNATAIRAFDDDTILPNLSVWTSIEALKDYVFRSDHVRFVRRRREWFAPMDDLPVLTMWWVPAGHLPTLEEAKERIDHLARHGPTAHAFAFHPTFEPPGQGEEGATAGLVRREVRSGARAGLPTRTTTVGRVCGADGRVLWDALTNPERIARWFLPVEGTLEVGGRYRLGGGAGGEIEACAEPESFTVTWEDGDSLSWVTVRLSPVDGGTEVAVSHESPVDPAFWAQYGPGATGLGWDLGLVGLARHVEDGRDFGPAAEEAFARSAEGAAFLETAGRGWALAAVADGDDEDQARAAAARSVAFYRPTDDRADWSTG